MSAALTPLLDTVSAGATTSLHAVSSAGVLPIGSDARVPVATYGIVDRALLADDSDVVPRERSERLCRIVNATVAVVGIVLGLPLLLLIAVAIKLTSRGPVLYAQTRVGLDRRWRGAPIGNSRRRHDYGGMLFKMYKFRSMHVNAESDGKAVWAVKCDPRVTPIGAFLRRTRLDELPQLYNVIRGDMNIVGPRPERPSIFFELRATIPEYATRQRVKPGITGWAQINQSYDTCIADVRRKTRLDIEYLRRQSLAEDLRIMTRTIPVMLIRRAGW